MKLQLTIDLKIDGKISRKFDMDLLAQALMSGIDGGYNSEDIEGAESEDFYASVEGITWDFMESDNEVKNILIKKKAKT
jgi:hypothetical protein